MVIMATRPASRTQTPAMEAWGLLQQIMMSQRSLFFEVASEFDLAPAQMHALKALEPGKPRPMSELAGALRCDNSNVTGIADRLEARGLVERRLCPGDGRARNAWLTDAGLGLLRAAQATHFGGVQRLFFDRMEPDEVAALAAIFGRFAPEGAGACST